MVMKWSYPNKIIKKYMSSDRLHGVFFSITNKCGRDPCLVPWNISLIVNPRAFRKKINQPFLDNYVKLCIEKNEENPNYITTCERLAFTRAL